MRTLVVPHDEIPLVILKILKGKNLSGGVETSPDPETKNDKFLFPLLVYTVTLTDGRKFTLKDSEICRPKEVVDTSFVGRCSGEPRYIPVGSYFIIASKIVEAIKSYS